MDSNFFNPYNDDPIDVNILFNEKKINNTDEEAEDKYAIRTNYDKSMLKEATVSQHQGKKEKDESKYITRGGSLFKNIGNTCWIDVILQINGYNRYLFASFKDTKSWKNISDRIQENIINKMDEQERRKNKLGHNDVVKIEHKKVTHAYENTITVHLKKLIDGIWKYNCNISAHSFKNLIGKLNTEFTNNGQHDSQELNSMILDYIHEETKIKNMKLSFKNVPVRVKKIIKLTRNCRSVMESSDATPEQKKKVKQIHTEYCKKHPADKIIMNACIYWRNYIKKGYSLVTKLFTGLYYSRIICDKCKRITSSFEPFTTFTIPTEEYGDTTLENCLKKFSEEELLTDKNKYNCKICGKVNAHKKMFIWEPPEILTIALKRFQNNGRFVSKTHAKVVFPIYGLELKDNYSDIRLIKNCVYDLVGIVKHTGSCYGGHYVAYCINPINNLWYHFDDTEDGYWHVPKDKLEEEIVTKNAYMLFYVKRMVCDVKKNV